MCVSLFIGYNARKYASQLPSYLYILYVCVCSHIYNYVLTTSLYTATKKYSWTLATVKFFDLYSI